MTHRNIQNTMAEKKWNKGAFRKRKRKKWEHSNSHNKDQKHSSGSNG